MSSAYNMKVTLPISVMGYDRLVHNIKGGGGNVGAKKVQKIAGALEDFAKDASPSTSIDKLIIDLETALNEVFESIEQLST